MPTKIDKVIVTHFGQLRSKYGAAGLRAIRAAIRTLQRADRTRGLQTSVIGLDETSRMRSLRGRAMTKADDSKQAKGAIDAIYRTLTPDYIMILGSHDVVPHQDLKNPLFKGRGGDDPDKFAWGDLPYACENPYSNEVTDFLGPTRVVGRLPDITASSDHRYLVRLLQTASRYRQVDRDQLNNYFAVGAQIWERSTSRTLKALYGNDSNFQKVPPHNARWAQKLLNSRVHFYNCHGAAHSSKFYGQPINRPAAYPTAADAVYMTKRIRPGTIAAAECCYGGQLYALSGNQPHPGMTNTYLGAEAYAFLASTTIAYGPARENGQADLICRYFIQNVMDGASSGRAVLEARLKFTSHPRALDPTDLKTIAQFNLYGDPSLTAVAPEPVAARAMSTTVAARRDRHQRRVALAVQGETVQATAPRIRRSTAVIPAAVLRVLRQQSRQRSVGRDQVMSFSVRYSGQSRAMASALAVGGNLTSAYHVLLTPRSRRSRSDQTGVHDIRGIIVEEVNGAPVSVREISSR
ncbi:hypothetical protein ABIB73_006417 [Bradyrhizobium sp. F1.4.3]|uniref:C25 family cysteine peptidase n=1 Tax=Bradyrhizobium sp. F1.4.3 TaxID=3156356 RepID=UPI0033925B53